MRNALLIGCLGAAIVAGAATQSLATGKQGAMGPRGERPSFEQLDTNGDGWLTPDEIAAHRKARFAEVDADGDGKVTRQEMLDRIAAHQAERRERMVNRMFAWRDTDGDGALAMDELDEGPGMGMFMMADEDGDGAISRDEFARMGPGHGRHKGHKRHEGHMDDMGHKGRKGDCPRGMMDDDN